jgi:anti-sigma regulatory factor (Ser/Thr protein kinase)
VTRPAGSEPDVVKPLELQLGRDERAPAQARAAVSAWCERLGVSSVRAQQAVVLLVSELVSNAVLHSKAPPGSSVTLAARLAGEAMRVSVSDAGEGFEPRPRDPAQLSDGYGLFLLDKMASRWGVDAAGSTSVWFELPVGEAA